METKKHTAEKLRMEMARLDMNRKDVAEMFEVTTATVTSWRKGYTEPPYSVVKTLEDMEVK